MFTVAKVAILVGNIIVHAQPMNPVFDLPPHPDQDQCGRIAIAYVNATWNTTIAGSVAIMAECEPVEKGV